MTHKHLFIALVLLAIASDARALEGAGTPDWRTYTNERYGFRLRYPAGVFASERQSETGDGEAFIGVRGHGRLLVGAFDNADGLSIDAYRNLIRGQSYSQYDVSYAPRGQSWFVLSGENQDSVFYEKVIFSCQGRVINSFALVYPLASKSFFDPIVEGIEKSFRPGQECRVHAGR